MDIFTSILENNLTKYKTYCCALAQLSANNETNFTDLKNAIESMKEQSKTEMSTLQRQNYGTHERAVFVITLESEEELVEKLVELGFKNIAQFHRRICYPQDQLLTMWFLEL